MKDPEKIENTTENKVEYNSKEFDDKIQKLNEEYNKIKEQLQNLENSLSTKIKDDILSKIFVKQEEEKKVEEDKKEEILEDF